MGDMSLPACLDSSSNWPAYYLSESLVKRIEDICSNWLASKKWSFSSLFMACCSSNIWCSLALARFFRRRVSSCQEDKTWIFLNIQVSSRHVPLALLLSNLLQAGHWLVVAVLQPLLVFLVLDAFLWLLPELQSSPWHRHPAFPAGTTLWA